MEDLLQLPRDPGDALHLHRWWESGPDLVIASTGLADASGAQPCQRL